MSWSTGYGFNFRYTAGFDNSAGDDWDVTGTYATDKANDTLIRALTSALNIEGYP